MGGCPDRRPGTSLNPIFHFFLPVERMLLVLIGDPSDWTVAKEGVIVLGECVKSEYRVFG
jgi:hypothetical protein